MIIKPTIYISIAVALLVFGLNMKAAVVKWEERVETQTEVASTKVENAIIGGGLGAVGGGLLAAFVGGIGIVVAGTGFGLPAGAALIGTAASIGAGAGAVTGAAMGDSEKKETIVTFVQHLDPAYEVWQWSGVIAIAALFFILGIYEMRKISQLANRNSQELE